MGRRRQLLRRQQRGSVKEQRGEEREKEEKEARASRYLAEQARARLIASLRDLTSPACLIPLSLPPPRAATLRVAFETRMPLPHRSLPFQYLPLAVLPSLSYASILRSALKPNHPHCPAVLCLFPFLLFFWARYSRIGGMQLSYYIY